MADDWVEGVARRFKPPLSGLGGAAPRPGDVIDR
jgi:hypothetical protein